MIAVAAHDAHICTHRAGRDSRAMRLSDGWLRANKCGHSGGRNSSCSVRKSSREHRILRGRNLRTTSRQPFRSGSLAAWSRNVEPLPHTNARPG
jgi:hypothetical protein